MRSRTGPLLAAACALLSATPVALHSQAGSAQTTSTQTTSTQTSRAAAEPTEGELDLRTVMAHPDWLGRQPERPYWANDSATVYYFRKKPRPEDHESEERLLYEASLDGRVLRTLEPWQHSQADVAGGSYDLERTRKTFARAGDVFVTEIESGETRQLTRNQTVERSPFFLVDGRVAFRRNQDLVARDLDSGLEETLFELRTEKDPIAKRNEEREKEDYLTRQQTRLLRTIREGRARSDYELESEREHRRLDETRADLPFYLGENLEIRQLAASPGGDHAVVTVISAQRERGRRDSMPLYVTESGYVEPREVRVKVGTAAEVGERLFLLDRLDHAITEISLEPLPGIHDDPLRELREAAENRKKTAKEDGGEASTEGTPEATEADEDSAPEKEEEQENEKEKARPVRFSPLLWSEDGSRVAIQAFSLDNKDRWIATLDLETATLVPRHRMHDAAWINRRFRDLGWLRDHRHLWFLSEESGYSQLYRMDAASDEASPPVALTAGQFVVDDVTLAPDGGHLYYTANFEHPGIYEVYRVAVDGASAFEAMTRLGGRNEYVLSPDGAKLLITHSTATRPPELYFQPAVAGAGATRLTETLSDAFLAIDWVEPEVVEVPSSHHDRAIYSRLYRPDPSTPAPSSGRPAVLFVHGAGYLQNSHLGWSGYFREFMFHTLLARRGYVVLDMDYRASAGYGRDWRTAIYRQMGTPELEDLADGVRYLDDEHGVDPDRVGVYGGSYGGFLTLMALFREPDLFAAGAALRPVTDWAHYNHGYTSNILNTPELDPEAYERSSPIEFAEGLSAPLLICTGMLDDNVFFQDSVRLVQRLIELEKEDWEIAIYPVEPHGFREPASWLDEYRRILELFETEVRASR